MEYIKKISELLIRIIDEPKIIRAHLQKKLLADCGIDVSIGLDCDFFYSHVHVGNHVFIGDKASFIASISHIRIGNDVMFGPNVTIRGGNHRIDEIGKLLYSEHDKLIENDKDVIIENDVWVGCNVTILKGVVIGHGAVIGAGSVVTKSIPSYAIAVGNPAKVIKYRLTSEEINEHEKLLGI